MYLHIHSTIESTNHVAAAHCKNNAAKALELFSDFDCGTIISDQLGGMSISEIADL